MLSVAPAFRGVAILNYDNRPSFLDLDALMVLLGSMGYLAEPSGWRSKLSAFHPVAIAWMEDLWGSPSRIEKRSTT